MSRSDNPFEPGDRVSIPRGTGRLHGEVVQVVLARVFTRVGERVFVDDYHEVELDFDAD